MPAFNKSSRRNDQNGSIFSRSLLARNKAGGIANQSTSDFNKSASSTLKNNTLFNKMFGGISRTRIIKQRYKNMNSIQASLDQKEQYKRLIEQYKTSSPTEQEKLFKIRNKKEATPQSKDEVIDLDLTNTVIAGNITATSKLEETRNAVTDILERSRQRIQALQEKNMARCSSLLKDSGDTANTSCNSFSKSYTNGNSSILPSMYIKNLFCPPNRYMSESFIPQLLKSYSSKERERQSQIAIAEARAKQIREKREAKEKMLEEILKEKLLIKEHLDEEVEEIELPELTDDMENAIDTALGPGPNISLVDEFNISIIRSHMQTLDGLNWLNDEIVNFYMELIIKRSKSDENNLKVHAMNTFFYPKLKSQSYTSVRRWTRRVDIFSKDIILYPIHLGVHWCLAIADFRNKELRYYDSMGGSNKECLEVLKSYLESEHLDKKKCEYDMSGWKLIVMSKNKIPQQMNGSDCGVFTCKFAEYIAADAEIDFTQDDMPYFRRAMVWEILNKNLLR